MSAAKTQISRSDEKLVGMLIAAYVCCCEGRKSIDRLYRQYRREFKGKAIREEWIELARLAHSFMTADGIKPNPTAPGRATPGEVRLAKMLRAAHSCWFNGRKSIDYIYERQQQEAVSQHWMDVVQHALMAHKSGDTLTERIQ